MSNLSSLDALSVSNKLRPETFALVTFALLTYNQERFIREAIDGALAQVYSPLEIIISDDCSTDYTFEIAKDTVLNYTGPHQIRLNRNAENMGLSSHVRYIHEISNGQIIIHAAGDDISFPQRVERIFETFSQISPRPSMVISNALKFDAKGKMLGLLSPGLTKRIIDRSPNPLVVMIPVVNGSTVAIDRGLIDAFPAPMKTVIAEDVVLMRRAYMLNGVVYIPDILVKYRINSGGVSDQGLRNQKMYLSTVISNLNDQVIRFRQLRLDIGHVSLSVDKLLLYEIDRQETAVKKRLKILEGNFGESTFGFVSAFFEGGKSVIVYKDLLRMYIIKWLPWLIGFSLW